MKIIKGTLKLTLILYICAALSGVYVLSASARITPHGEGDESTILITIEKGDTLWDLCQEHLKDPLRWRELSKYNDFTNPHLIYPGEKLRIPVDMVKNIVELAEGETVIKTSELEELQRALELLEEAQLKLAEEQAERKKEEEAYAAKLAKLQAELEAAAQSGKSIAQLQKEVEERIAETEQKVRRSVAQLQKDLEQKSEETGKELSAIEAQLKANGELLVSIQAEMAKLLKEIEINQQGINELKSLIIAAEGIHEKPSKAKRALVFLTTAAAGIGWFAMNAIGGRK